MIKKLKIDKIIIVYIIFLVLASFFRFPDIKDEFKYIYLTDNLIERKNFIILKYFGELYPDKPPLYFWILVLLRYIFRENFFPLSLVLCSIFPMILISLKSYKFIVDMDSDTFGNYIFKLFITLPFIVGISLILRMDMLLTFWIISSIYIFFEGYYSNKWDKKNIFLMYIYIALGILTKGGAGIVVPILTIITFLFLEKNFKILKEIKFLRGILFVLFIILFWFFSLSKIPEGKDYISLMIGRETIGRVLNSKTHMRPFYFYLIHTPLTFFILFPFVFLQIYRLSKKIKYFKTWNRLDKISYSWFIPNFIFFSLCSGKLDIYLLPIYPAMIILAVRYLTEIGLERYISKIIKLQIILVLTAISGVYYYTDNYTLKPFIKNIESSNNLYSFRFNDAKNLYYMIGKKRIRELGDDDLGEIKKGDLIILKVKNMERLEGLNYIVIEKNKSYLLLKVK